MLIFFPYTIGSMQKSSIHILFQVSTEEIENSRRGSFKRGFGKDSSRRWHFSRRAFIYFSSIGCESAGSPGTFQVLSLALTKGLSSPLESDESYFQCAPDVIKWSCNCHSQEKLWAAGRKPGEIKCQVDASTSLLQDRVSILCLPPL